MKYFCRTGAVGTIFARHCSWYFSRFYFGYRVLCTLLVIRNCHGTLELSWLEKLMMNWHLGLTTSTLLVIVAPERLPSHLLGLSDASDYACSLFISFIDNEQKVVYHNWSPTESSTSSPWRGLKTAVLTLSAFALEHQGKKKNFIGLLTTLV